MIGVATVGHFSPFVADRFRKADYTSGRTEYPLTDCNRAQSS